MIAYQYSHPRLVIGNITRLDKETDSVDNTLILRMIFEIRNKRFKPGRVEAVEIRRDGKNSRELDAFVVRIDKQKIQMFNSEYVQVNLIIQQLVENSELEDRVTYRLNFTDNHGQSLINKNTGNPYVLINLVKP